MKDTYQALREGLSMELSTEEKIKIANDLRNKSAKKCIDQSLLEQYPVKEIKDMNVETKAGKTHIYIHYPVQGKFPYPLYVNMHGGGFVKGHSQWDELFCRKVCNNVNCAVIDVDYKIAPEFMFPCALNECYNVVKWVYENYNSLGIDKNKISIGGHSAGANIAAGIALMANASGDFPVLCQVLDYPPVDLYSDPETKNIIKNETITKELARTYTDMYINVSDRKNPLASPLYASKKQLTGLPKTLIITAELDYLCSEGEEYALMLARAGVEVTVKRFLGSVHGFTINLQDGYMEAEKMVFKALNNANNETCVQD